MRPSPWWWAVRIPALALFLAAWWHSDQDDYRAAYHLLLAIFVLYAVVGTPPPVWPRAKDGAA